MTDWYIPPLSKVFPAVRWTTGSMDVWLTFDDGPHPDATPALLDVLKAERVSAVFFLLGRNANEHPSLLRSIADGGHIVGNHSYDHRPVWSMRKQEFIDSLRRTNEAIASSGSPAPVFFRPPYGRFLPGTVRTARELGLETTMFSVDSRDFAGGPPTEIVERVIRRTRPGDILLFHDNGLTAANIAPIVRSVIRRLRASGLAFGTPSTV